MRRSILALAALAALAAAPAQAQITITTADVRALYMAPQTVRTFDLQRPAGSAELGAAEQAKFQAIAQADSGPWDFTGVAYSPESRSTEEAVPLAQTPGANDPDFAGSDLTIRYTYGASPDSVQYLYNTLDNARFATFGTITRGDVDPSTPGTEQVKATFRPALSSLVFPVAVGSSWSTQAMLTVEPTPFPFTTTVTWAYTVASGGTLVTPAGSAPALKLRQRIDFVQTFFGVTTMSTQYAYSFVTKDSRFTAAVTTDDTGKVLSAAYIVRGAGGTAAEPGAGAEALALASAPNPARGASTLSFEMPQAGRARLSVVDALGREVAVLVDCDLGAGPHRAAFDARSLPPGVYVARLAAGGEMAMRRLTVVR